MDELEIPRGVINDRLIVSNALAASRIKNADCIEYRRSVVH